MRVCGSYKAVTPTGYNMQRIKFHNPTVIFKELVRSKLYTHDDNGLKLRTFFVFFLLLTTLLIINDLSLKNCALFAHFCKSAHFSP